MKIGIFVDSFKPYISGVVTSVQMLADGLKELGHEVVIFTVNLENGIRMEHENVLYFEGVYMKTKGVRHFKKIKKMKSKVQVIKSYNLDIIHLHTEFSLAKLAVLCSKKLNIPLIYTFHTLYEDYLRYVSPSLDKYFHKTLLNIFNKMFIEKPKSQSSAIIVPTQKVNYLKENYGITTVPYVIPTGIKIDVFKEENPNILMELKKQYNIKDEFVFLSLGRISAEKSLDKVLQAFSTVSNKMNAKLIIVGVGPYLDTLKQLAKDYKLEEKVIFTGEIPYGKIRSFFHLANVKVNASTSETQGLTYIEALASGRPLLVKKDEATKDLVVDGVNGYVFENIEQMADKMLHVYNNKVDLEKMKQACYDSVDKYSHITYAKSVLKVYEDVLNKV